MKSKYKNILIPIVILLVAIGWFVSFKYLTFNNIKQWTIELQTLSELYLPLTLGTLFFAHFFGSVFSLPTKAVVNMVAGALLGIFLGTTITLLGVLAGTSVLFIATQKLLLPKEIHNFNGFISTLKHRFSDQPILTVMSLRLILALPYGVITIASAVFKIKFYKFLTGSIIGDLPVVLLYSTAGLKLAELASKKDAISIETIIILSVAGIGLFAGVFFKKPKPRASINNT